MNGHWKVCDLFSPRRNVGVNIHCTIVLGIVVSVYLLRVDTDIVDEYEGMKVPPGNCLTV